MRPLERALSALLAVLVLAGCGGGADGGNAGDPAGASGPGGATLWVTHDEGRSIVLIASVPTGDSVLQALDRRTDVETRYGGRFVQSINGVEGSLDRRRDWFFFVNGIEPGIGSAEVELRAGDVAWWDYRDWGRRVEAPIVVGAFPEPFLHGWEGERRPAEVEAPRGFEEEAAALLRVLGGPGGEGDSNVFEIVVDSGTEGATLRARRGPGEGSPARFTLAGSEAAVRGAARALARDPSYVRFRYIARFDDEGDVIR